MKHEAQDAIDAVLAVDRLVHEPARLAILTVLSGAELVEFGFLETVCRLSKGNLSSHLSKLEAAGLVSIDKSFRGKRPLTRVSITDTGRAALQLYRAQIAALTGSPPMSNEETTCCPCTSFATALSTVRPRCRSPSFTNPPRSLPLSSSEDIRVGRECVEM